MPPPPSTHRTTWKYVAQYYQGNKLLNKELPVLPKYLDNYFQFSVFNFQVFLFLFYRFMHKMNEIRNIIHSWASPLFIFLKMVRSKLNEWIVGPLIVIISIRTPTHRHFESAREFLGIDSFSVPVPMFQWLG